MIYEHTLAIKMRVLGKGHLETLITANNLGLVLRSMKQYPQAEALLRTTVSGRSAAVGKMLSATLHAKNQLGMLYIMQERWDEAFETC